MKDLVFAILFLTELLANQQLKRPLYHAPRARTPNAFRPKLYEALDVRDPLMLPSDVILPCQSCAIFRSPNQANLASN
jgi:hypothetical protein